MTHLLSNDEILQLGREFAESGPVELPEGADEANTVMRLNLLSHLTDVHALGGTESGGIILRATVKSCPGYGGEDCGGPLESDGDDLCPDCHGARLDVESPRIGR